MKLGRTPEEIENERKRLLLCVLAGLGSVFLCAFGTVSAVQGRWLLAGVLFCLLGIVVSVALLARKLDRVQPVSLFLSAALLPLALYLLLGGGAEGTGVYWSYPISMLMVILVGPRAGIVYMALYLAISSAFMYGPLAYPLDYTATESIRITVTSLALYVLILASEWIRVGAYEAISEASETHRSLANTDQLTALLNRHGVQAALGGTERETHAVLTLLDVDNFKSINDRYGHDFGDEVLKALAGILRAHTKGRDLTARWGGEEFMLILFDTEMVSAEALVNKIRHDFSGRRFSYDDVNVYVTFSAGMSVLEGGANFEAAVKLADQRLYKAKALGRNKMVSCDAGACMHCLTQLCLK